MTDGHTTEEPEQGLRASSATRLVPAATMPPKARSLRELLDRPQPEDGVENDTQVLLMTLLNEAFGRNVSDIHLDPADHGYELRFRVDGVLRDVGTIDGTRGL